MFAFSNKRDNLFGSLHDDESILKINAPMHASEPLSVTSVTSQAAESPGRPVCNKSHIFNETKVYLHSQITNEHIIGLIIPELCLCTQPS